MEKYYLEKISNLKEIRRFSFTIFMTLSAGLGGIYLGREMTAKVLFVLIFGGLADAASVLYCIHIDNLINKYLRRLK